MRFLVRGRKRISGEEVAPLEIEAPSELAARSEAMARGIKVESVEPVDGGEAVPTHAAGGYETRTPAEAVQPPRARSGGYEFSGRQEELIGGLARYMRIAGALSVLFGLLQFLAMLMGKGNAMVLVQGVFMLVFGGLVWSIGGRFRVIAETTGRDIENLMEALAGLKLMYGIQVWAAGIALVLMVLVIVLALLGALR